MLRGTHSTQQQRHLAQFFFVRSSAILILDQNTWLFRHTLLGLFILWRCTRFDRSDTFVDWTSKHVWIAKKTPSPLKSQCESLYLCFTLLFAVVEWWWRWWWYYFCSSRIYAFRSSNPVSCTTKNQIIIIVVVIVYIMIVGYVCPFTFNACCCCCWCCCYSSGSIFFPSFFFHFVPFSLQVTEQPDTWRRRRRRQRQQQRRPSSYHHRHCQSSHSFFLNASHVEWWKTYKFIAARTTKEIFFVDSTQRKRARERERVRIFIWWWL